MSSVKKMIDLSTAHMPSDAPDFGDFRVVDHEHGWIVFVDDETEPPDWLVPIMVFARKDAEIMLVNFDNGADEDPAFNTYEW